MNKAVKASILALVIFSLVFVIIPLITPIPPLENIKPVSDLTLVDSQFLTINEINFHFTDSGQGNTQIVLLHGFGSWLYTWNEVRVSLSTIGRVLTYDRPAFGLTDRPLRTDWIDGNPYLLEKQPDYLIAMMDKLGIKQAILAGNSAGGTVALLTAQKYPDRVQALIFIDAAIINTGGTPTLIQWIASFPTFNRIGPLFMRNIESWGTGLLDMAWHDPSKISTERLEWYKKPLQTENWDVALWELTRSTKNQNFRSVLNQIKIPVLVITGDDDQIVPTDQSIALAGMIENSKLVILDDCGHVPQEECPQELLKAMIPFIESATNPKED